MFLRSRNDMKCMLIYMFKNGYSYLDSLIMWISIKLILFAGIFVQWNPKRVVQWKMAWSCGTFFWRNWTMVFWFRFLSTWISLNQLQLFNVLLKHWRKLALSNRFGKHLISPCWNLNLWRLHLSHLFGSILALTTLCTICCLVHSNSVKGKSRPWFSITTCISPMINSSTWLLGM